MNKSAGLACFLKIVCQNEKCLKSKINSLVNLSNKNDQWDQSLICYKTWGNIKAQKDAGSINVLEYIEKSIKDEPEDLLEIISSRLYNNKYMIISRKIPNSEIFLAFIAV